MGAQLMGGNTYSGLAGLAGQHGGPGNAAMFNQMTATPQYQQGLNQQGMAMQGLNGLMQALAYYHQRKQDQEMLHPKPQSVANPPEFQLPPLAQDPWSMAQMGQQNSPTSPGYLQRLNNADPYQRLMQQFSGSMMQGPYFGNP